MIVLSCEQVANKSSCYETLTALIDFWCAIAVRIDDLISTFCSTYKHIAHNLMVKSSETVAIILDTGKATTLNISALCPL